MSGRAGAMAEFVRQLGRGVRSVDSVATCLHGVATASTSMSVDIICGACVGLAQRFTVSPTLVCALFVASCLLPGPQILSYLALWIAMPSED